MAETTDNLPDVEALLDTLARGVQFTDHGIGKSIGEEALDICAEGIIDRTIQRQVSPADAPLAELNPKYKAWKARKGFPGLITIKTGNMMSLDEVQGERLVSGESAEMRYGKTSFARDKMQWITEGRDGVQPPRPVWGLDDAIRAKVGDYLQGRFTAWLRTIKGGA